MTDSHYWETPDAGYEGDNIDLLTLSGDNPDAAWIAHTLARRVDTGHCACGCNQSHGDKSVLNPKCVKHFKKRLDILDPEKAKLWREWLDEDQPMDTESSEEWYWVLADLRELQIDLWCAENRTAIQELIEQTNQRLERLRNYNHEDDVTNVERLNRALNLVGPIGSRSTGS